MTRSQPDPRILAAAEADDVAEFHGLPRKHARLDDDAPSPKLTVLVLIMATLVVLTLAAVFTMPATPAPYTGPGYEAACWGGC